MPQPTRADVHVNKPLTNISIAFIQRQQNFIADRVFPIIPVQKQSDRFFKYTKSNWFRTEAEKRAPATESAGSGFDIDNTPSYFADVWSVHKDVDDQIRANADAPINMDRDATEFVTQQLLLRKEKEWVNSFFGTGIWDTDLTGVAATPGANQFLQWDQADSTPIEDITNEKQNVAEKTGFMPNTLVLGPKVFNVLTNHADILDRIKFTQRGIVTTDLLASVLGVDRVLVPLATENTAAEGATDSFSFFYGKQALLAFAAPRPSILQPSAGYTFSWTGLLGAGQQGTRIRRFRMDNLQSDRIEGDMAFDQKVIASELATFFDSAIS